MLQAATQRLVEWNSNYGDTPDKCVLFHCSKWAKDFLPDIRIGTAPILGTMFGEALNGSPCAAAVAEALATYRGWEVYRTAPSANRAPHRRHRAHLPHDCTILAMAKVVHLRCRFARHNRFCA